MIEGILFDLDGVLADTEPIRCASTREVLSMHGIDLGEKEFYDHWTRKGRNLADFLVEKGINLDAGEIREERIGVYHRMLRERLKPIDNADSVVRRLSEKYQLGLVTGSYRSDAKEVLEILGIAGYFKVMITSEDVQREKPNPDGFLLASARLGIPPVRIVTIEDAEKGVVASYMAGMKCIAIPREATKNKNIFKPFSGLFK
ncbi:MAG: HAD family phosphatase [Nanoarchaeota archaeon]